ncbi:MAG: pyruvate formate-lyase 1-activating enzyme [Firmicutes bacterium HGW-Firmicutes-1]|jgi:pyruvate formate lyase activating enzyme|nr:MAG: pyruvate formate-lyase 1-activating enzyme [Firmicutes bacterium HGW-Firmicutes-1]
MEDILGKIHSIETCGTLDGPGIRFVVFMQGCNLRCQYCHNPDTWDTTSGTIYTPTDLFKEILNYESYMRFSNGGITVTGGEPLLQIDFLIQLFMLCKEHGIHTVLDTAGSIFNDKVKILLEWTDLVILDIKSFDKVQYLNLTGAKLQPTIEFIDYTNTIQKSIWIRYVLVPNLTDDLSIISDLSKFLGSHKYIEKIEVLPFHKLGEYKWEALNLPYTLLDTSVPTESDLLKVLEAFYKYNRNVVIV